jgi:hypothetical protein
VATVVTITAYISGARDGKPWPAAGQTISLPDGEAATLIAAGLATP